MALATQQETSDCQGRIQPLATTLCSPASCSLLLCNREMGALKLNAQLLALNSTSRTSRKGCGRQRGDPRTKGQSRARRIWQEWVLPSCKERGAAMRCCHLVAPTKSKPGLLQNPRTSPESHQSSLIGEGAGRALQIPLHAWEGQNRAESPEPAPGLGQQHQCPHLKH